MPTLKDAREKVRDLSAKALEYAEDAKLTTAEKAAKLDEIEPEIKTWIDEVSVLERFEEHRDNFEKSLGGSQLSVGDPKAEKGVKSIGEQFAESAGYKSLVERGLKGGSWSTGDIEIKTTLTEGTSGSQGPGGALVWNTPQVIPGVLPILFQPLTIADMLPGGTTTSPLIRYMVESAVTNAAAPTAEGGTYPESALTFTKVDETLHKITTFLPVTDEMIEDYEQIVSYINGRLVLFVKIDEETELLKGDGTGDHLTGLQARSGKATTIVKGTSPSTGDDNDMDVIYRQITAIRTGSFLEPDGIVIDPTAWQTIQLSKNSQGMYYAGGPFMDTANPALWGKRVNVSTAQTAGFALVGAFAQAAQVFRKGGITVEASNSHSDWFIKGTTAVRCEERVGLAVYRPAAFGLVTGL